MRMTWITMQQEDFDQINLELFFSKQKQLQSLQLYRQEQQIPMCCENAKFSIQSHKKVNQNNDVIRCLAFLP